jgi:hypothetical protein
VIRSRLFPRIAVVGLAIALFIAWPVPARAQWHGHVHGPAYPVYRSSVFVGVGIGYPGYFYPWFYPWYPYPYGV